MQPITIRRVLAAIAVVIFVLAVIVALGVDVPLAATLLPLGLVFLAASLIP